MKERKLFLFVFWVLIVGSGIAFTINKYSYDERIVSYIANPKTQNIQLYWKDDNGKLLKSIQNLKVHTESKNGRLIFAMNGGMFNRSYTPQGLFIQYLKTITPLDTLSGNGNFYLKPNGVFYITTDNTPFVCRTEDFVNTREIKYATQSGPMLVMDGKIHPAFKKGSDNLNIRNGVGILPDNRVVFAISKMEINFYDFASYFLQLGCKNALYLDGYVSRAYIPEKKWIQTDGEFGVMIGVTNK